jgi:four helix bundle protein
MAEWFEDLRAWKTARSLTNEVYVLTKRESFANDWALKDQIRRASISVMPNIAEGFESRTRSQFINFLGTAKASAGEVRSRLVIAHDQEYLSDETFSRINDLADKMSRQLYHLIGHLEQNDGSDRVHELPTEYVTD